MERETTEVLFVETDETLPKRQVKRGKKFK
jgi:hypothetical protein